MLHAAALIVLALACQMTCWQECMALMGADVARLDTIRAYDRTAGRVSYRSKDIKRQCLRLRLPPGTIISEVVVWLSGPAGACGKLEIFGHEGGLLAPRLEKPLITAMKITKMRDGREAVPMAIEGGLVHTSGQLFIVVTDLSDSVRLMCSGAEEPSECVESSGQGRYASLQQKSSGAWVSTGFTPWIDIVAQRPNQERGTFVRDTLVDDLKDRSRRGTSYLSCLDVGGDGRVDIASAGVLLVNRTTGFVALDLAGNDEEAPYAFGLDTDGDGKEELLTMNVLGDDKITVNAFTASETVARRSDIQLPLLLAPSSMSQFDVNGDGRTDLVLAGSTAGSHEPVCVLLLSSGLYGYQAKTLFDEAIIKSLALSEGETPVVQFISPMSKITTGGEAGGLLVRSSRADLVIDVAGATAGGHRHNVLFDSDSAMSTGLASSSFMRDSVASAPFPIAWRQLGKDQISNNVAGLPDSRRSDAGEKTEMVIRAMPDYEEALSAIVLADLDNDGSDEYIVCSQGTCRYLRVFSLIGSELQDVTFDVGLSNIDDCPDVVVADFDLDGRLDLAFARRGRLELWMNNLTIPRCHWSVLTGDVNSVEDAGSQDSKSGNARWLHSSSISGRGRLVQDVRSVQSSQSVDSVSVRWAGAGNQGEVFAAAGRRFTKGSGVLSGASHAEPKLTIAQDGQSLQLVATDRFESVRLKIVTTDGRTIGNTMRELGAEGKHVISLSEVMRGQQLASGQYTAMAEAGGESATCLIVIVR
ncbi:MAG: VCBS repeat-containing protein [Ignavibacteria bacterium]|nr:VCBS repeat-containing protein [Ignavibacteria bacterium]